MASPYESVKFTKLEGLHVVTGGNRGIGRAISFALAQANSNVAIIYRASKDAPDVAKEIQDRFQNVSVRAYQCDVLDFEKLKETLNHIEKDFKQHITGVFANAGVSIVKPALDLDYDDFKKVYDVNVFGVDNTCRAAAQLWLNRNQQGSIVITASMSARIINQTATNQALTQCGYNSSKAAVVQLMRAFAAEWAEHGIHVNSISPGYVETDQTKHMDKEILRHQRDNIPLKRFAEPKEIAPLALFLSARHLASYITGADYLVDGGQTVW